MAPSLPDNRLDHWEDGPAMYFIMPDRFANGDPSNDDVEGQEKASTEQRCTPVTVETWPAWSRNWTTSKTSASARCG